jgi:hypothetical protein
MVVTIATTRKRRSFVSCNGLLDSLLPLHSEHQRWSVLLIDLEVETVVLQSTNVCIDDLGCEKEGSGRGSVPQLPLPEEPTC